jgi:hypothetical protein
MILKEVFMYRHTYTVLLSALILVLAVSDACGAGPSRKIEKCQDAQGLWHYGDSAAAECAHSKVTIMSEEGVTKKVIAAPPTEAELKARAAQAAAQAEVNKRAEEQKKKDELLLSTYAVEDDIRYVRDRKIAQIESQISATNDTLKSLNAVLARLEKEADAEQKTGKISPDTAKHLAQTRQQIADREADIANKRKEEDAIRAEAESDMVRYRQLKGTSAPATENKNKPSQGR